MLKKIVFQIFMMGVIGISFPSCHGILDDIYDTPLYEGDKEYGFIETNSETHSGTIYVDAHLYTQWTYIDFDGQQIHVTNIDVPKGEEIEAQPVSWQLALHRYDTKTNEGSVMETTLGSLGEVRKLTQLPEGTFVADVQDKVATDMSGMMDDNILYAESPVNQVLGRWLNVDKSSMPPIYTLSKKVYLLQTKEGKYAAIYLSNYMNEAFVKGYMTIDYIYPLEF